MLGLVILGTVPLGTVSLGLVIPWKLTLGLVGRYRSALEANGILLYTEYVASMWNYILPSLLKAVENEPERDIQAEVMSSLAQVRISSSLSPGFPFHWGREKMAKAAEISLCGL